jgi:hypothetical protein
MTKLEEIELRRLLNDFFGDIDTEAKIDSELANAIVSVHLKKFESLFSSQHTLLLEEIKGMKKLTNDDWKCKICGYEGGECECIGYNKAIDDILALIDKHI